MHEELPTLDQNNIGIMTTLPSNKTVIA